MASDGLNEIGKYIKETRNNANYALNRYQPRRNAVERVRDIFDPTNSFTMKFKTKEGHTNAVLDLRFEKPPPTRNWGSGCFKSSCEQFTAEQKTMIFTLKEPYVAGTAVVFMNGSLLSLGKYQEYNPSLGQVKVLPGPRFINTIIICSAKRITSDATYYAENGAATGFFTYYSKTSNTGWTTANYAYANTGAIGGKADFAHGNDTNKLENTVMWTVTGPGTMTVYTRQPYWTTVPAYCTLSECSGPTRYNGVIALIKSPLLCGEYTVVSVDEGTHYYRLTNKGPTEPGFGFDGMKWLPLGGLDCNTPLPSTATQLFYDCTGAYVKSTQNAWWYADSYNKIVTSTQYNCSGPSTPTYYATDSSQTTATIFDEEEFGSGYYRRGLEVDMGSTYFVTRITFMGQTGSESGVAGADLHVLVDGTEVAGTWKEDAFGWDTSSLTSTIRRWTFYPSANIMYGRRFLLREDWDQPGLAYRLAYKAYGILINTCSTLAIPT